MSRPLITLLFVLLVVAIAFVPKATAAAQEDGSSLASTYVTPKDAGDKGFGVEAPSLPPRSNPDIPGNSAPQGVIPPPVTGDAGINKRAPPPNEYPTPVIPPPGSPHGDQRVIPK
jgi:hypothetical protein